MVQSRLFIPIKRKKVITDVYDLKRLARRMKGRSEFAFDTETNTLRVYGPNNKFKLVGISISFGSYDNYYIPTGHFFDEVQLGIETVVKWLKPIFENPNVRIIGTNILFDLNVLKRIGITVQTEDLVDIMICSWICDENKPKGLKENSQRILGIDQTHFGDVLSTVTKEQKAMVGLKGNQKPTYDLVSIENGSPYAIDDAYYTWCLYVYYLDRMVEEGMDKIYFKTYPQFLTTLFRMECRGINVDIPKLSKMGEDMAKDLDELTYKMLELAGVHVELTSTQQLAQLLYGYSEFKNVNPQILKASFKFPITSTTGKGVPQVNASTLEAIVRKNYSNKRKQEGVEFCKLLLEHKKLSKLKSAFVDGLLEQLYDDGKAHPSFNPVGADSGRISCSSPNLMQMPNASDEDKYQIRSVFIGDMNRETGVRDKIISVDYSNLEVRVMAHFSKDENLLHAFKEGKDLHGNTAKMMFRLDCDANDVKKLHPELRQQGKVIAFLLQYGGSATTLCDDLNKDGDLDKIAKEQGGEKKSDFYGCKNAKDVAQRLMDLYFKGFPGIAKFMKHQKKIAHRQGYINTIVGRKRRLPDIHSSNFGKVSYCERLSINACIQGSGADIMINAQNRIEGTNPCTISKDYAKEHKIKKPFIVGDRLRELQCKMLVQIHDELLFTCPEENCEEAIQLIRDCMIHPFGDKVKLNVDLEIGAGFSDSYQGGH